MEQVGTNTHRASSSDKIVFLNQLRGLAALCVVFAHFFQNFFFRQNMVAGYIHAPALENLDAPLLAKYFNEIPALSFGETGVALFFLISGFVIPMSLEKYGSVSFLVARFFRIWPTYVTGLMVSLLCFFFISRVHDFPFPFEFKEILVQSVIFLRDWLWFPNIDGIVWTLEIEIKFYVLMAAFFWIFGGMDIRKIAIFMVVLCVVLIISVGLKSLIYQNIRPLYYMLNVVTFNISIISFMLCGTVFHHFYKQRLSVVGFWFYMAVFSGCFALTWSYGIYVSGRFAIPHYFSALAFFSLCFILRELFRHNRLLDYFARISYPLYVVHAPLGYITMSLLILSGAGETPALLAAFSIAFFAATALHHLVERPSQSLGKKLSRFSGARLS